MTTSTEGVNPARLAGFIDGDGSISIRWQRSKRDRHVTSTVASVAISQAEPREWILYELQREFGGSVVSHGTDIRNPKTNRALRWCVTGAKAVQVCRQVFPYLILKKRHAEILLEHQATKLPSHIGCRKGMSPKTVRIPEDTIRLRGEHIRELEELNRRGKWQ